MLAMVGIRNAISQNDYRFDSHIEDQLPLNEAAVMNYLSTYPPNSHNQPGQGVQKVAFVPNTDSRLTGLIQTFQSVYPELAASVVTAPSSDFVDSYLKGGLYGSDGNNPYYVAVVSID